MDFILEDALALDSAWWGGYEDAISSACSSSFAERLVELFIEPTNFVPVKTSDGIRVICTWFATEILR